MTDSAENSSELDAVLLEVKAYGLIAEKGRTKISKKVQKPYRIYEYNGYTIKVGKNNVENDLLVKSAHPSDMWFHTKNGRSSHLLLKVEGKPLEDNIIVACAEICSYFSADRECDKTEVVYTEKRNVKKPPQSPLGFVTYTNYKSISVKPNMHEDMIKS